MKYYDEPTSKQLIDLLTRLSDCSPPLSPAWRGEILAIIEAASLNHQLLCTSLNNKRIWGGADSLANEALNDNGDLAEAEWQMRVREFRDVMIEMGELLRSQGDAYPDIQPWLLAFHNWNNANV